MSSVNLFQTALFESEPALGSPAHSPFSSTNVTDPEHPMRNWLRIVHSPTIGCATLVRLLKAHGSAALVMAAAKSGNRHAVYYSRDVALERIASSQSAQLETLIDQTLVWLEQPNHHLLTIDDPAYPQKLLQVESPPMLLYCIGRIELLNQPSIAIVGSRQCSVLGAKTTHAFAHDFVERGITVVSGMALGIDAAAHSGALLAANHSGVASSVGVLGTGINLTYPRGNLKLYQQMAQLGCLVSEFALGTKAASFTFPRRNRIIAGLSAGVLVMEAARNSGSLITARDAGKCGREVFAVPGSIHSPVSKGCHQLIKEGAKLVESSQCVLEELAQLRSSDEFSLLGAALNKSALVNSNLADSSQTAAFGKDPWLQWLGFEAISVDQLRAHSGHSLEQWLVKLSEWELRGLIQTQADGTVIRVSH
jgi:DNA processing protein